MYSVAIDTGGTFTDVTLMNLQTGQLWVTKTPSTPADPSEAFLTGVLKVLRIAGAQPEEVAYVYHGTTVATNAVLEGKGARTALVTTEGFKYVLDIGRHDIPRGVNMYSWIKPTRPVTPDLIFEVSERLDKDGSVLTPVRPEQVMEVAEEIGRRDVSAVAVCTIHSYVNPAHEKMIAEELAARLPGVYVTRSTEVLAEFREYERSMVTVLNATVTPVMQRYLYQLRGRLRDAGIRGPVMVMKSNGGIASAEDMGRQAIYSVLSGPAAGVVGAIAIGELAGVTNLISLDMGGTSTDVSLTRNSRCEVTTETVLAGFPVPVPALDIITIGAGGGSIARVHDGVLHVGPESAGAAPGPVAYRKGGVEPTVTDANLLLGRIPASLAAGEITLDVEASRQAIRERVGEPLGLTVEEAAYGILEIVDNTMAGAVRAVSIERGHDPGSYALVAFGGAGPVHSSRLAELLGMSSVLIPRNPGVLSTFGLLATRPQIDFVQTCLERGPDYDLERLELTYQDLMGRAERWFEQEGIPREQREFRRYVDLRYRHQGYHLIVPLSSGRMDGEALRSLIEAFHAEHQRLYSYTLPEAPVEIVSLRLTAIGQLTRIEIPEAPARQGTVDRARSGTRPVYFQPGMGYVQTPVYERDLLCPGDLLAGPAVIDQTDASTVLFPGHTATVDRWGNLTVTVLRM